uniref:Senescence domain-containing protein n=1 Tax=Aegilops tauschii subsp. strangulata TaxID=200361 RepID=A0A453IIX8_AEGTS
MHFSSVFCRARRVTKMSNKVANSILSGVLKVSGFVTSTVVNSKPAQKFFKLMPGEVILASLDGFGKRLPLAVHVTFAWQNIKFNRSYLYSYEMIEYKGS